MITFCKKNGWTLAETALETPFCCISYYIQQIALVTLDLVEECYSLVILPFITAMYLCVSSICVLFISFSTKSNLVFMLMRGSE